MNENIELGNFRDLLESMDSYSKVIEVAISVDEKEHGTDTTPSTKSIFNLYGGAIKELLSMEQQDEEYETSIFLELKEDDFSGEQYIDVHLINDNYSDTIVIQPEMNFDDYRNYKTFALDFMPWSQILNKSVRVSKQVADRVSEGCTLEEFVLGHIMWELTFYGFSSKQVASEMDSLLELSKESAVETTLEELMEETNNLTD
jgi:hypothetical protein